MTGAEHYREAERLADQAHHYTYGDGADPVTGAALAAEGQVHATLALAAATALLGSVAGTGTGYDDVDLKAWVEAAGEQSSPSQGGESRG